jgi:hypothetical protein
MTNFLTKTVGFAVAVAAVLPMASAMAADLPAKAPKKSVIDVPFFLVTDNRVTYSYMPDGTDPGVNKTAKSVYSFTHFDVWAYGTNFFTISALKSDHRDPASPCGSPTLPGASGCAGATEIYGLTRSTLGWNELFDTKTFTMGPLRNISFEAGIDMNSMNSFYGSAKRDVVAGLQFSFDLPYKGYLNVSPLYYKEWGHNAYTQCGLFGPGVVGVTCSADGAVDFHGTWAVEANYYMDLNFLPAWLPLSISGRAGFYGSKGLQNSPLPGPAGGTKTAVEINSEPIRLTLDASRALGSKEAHLVDVWVAYRYWQNKFGLDHSASPTCTVGLASGSCTEETVYTGVTVKF